jgi:hypothetical protein
VNIEGNDYVRERNKKEERRNEKGEKQSPTFVIFSFFIDI